MAGSSDVAANDPTLATDYNKLRADVLDNATGHDHEDTDGKLLQKEALRFTNAKLLLGAGAGAAPTEVDREVIADLTVPIFQMLPAIGTGTNNENINDNDTATACDHDAIGEYTNIFFLHGLKRIQQWRQYGHNDNNGTGRFTLQYLDEDYAWQDWDTGIATKDTAAWTNWASLAVVNARAIKILCTTVDTFAAKSRFGELEVKY